MKVIRVTETCSCGASIDNTYTGDFAWSDSEHALKNWRKDHRHAAAAVWEGASDE